MSYMINRTPTTLPRFPEKGNVDLTYRCNNRCRHCWIVMSPDKPEEGELTFAEIRCIAEEASKCGCREWGISGGEPLLHPDFWDIFDYLTSVSRTYYLNTNGTLVSKEIAKLLKRKGHKLVSLYGATRQVHDHITRTPGSFEKAIRGMNYLRDAGAGFTVQIMPMKDNYHQLRDMASIADSLSRPWRLGGDWLYLNAYGDPGRNEKIREQRLDPKCVLELDPPGPCDFETGAAHAEDGDVPDDVLFKECIRRGGSFHVDPYGWASFCCYVRDPVLRYDLREGSFQDYWDEFLPSILHQIRGGQEFVDNCGTCDLRGHCRWCPAYAYLEHGRYSAKVDYLCSLAREKRDSMMRWRQAHQRHYELAGIGIQVDCDLPILDETYHPRLRLFEVDRCGEDPVRIRHHFSVPKHLPVDLGHPVFDRQPWTIFRKGASTIYHMCDVWMECDEDYGSIDIYHCTREVYEKGKAESLTLLPSDAIVLAQALAYRNAVSVHASGAAIDGHGVVFVGHSGAGKSTMAKILERHAEILCDEQMIVRKWREGFRVHGTWSHGEFPVVSPNSAPLRAICFLIQSEENSAELIVRKSDILERLVPCVIKPLETRQWWIRALDTVEDLIDEVPCYLLKFDKSGRVIERVKELCNDPG